MTRAFVVSWIIDVDAETPQEAARIAQAIQRDPDSTATVFIVEEHGHAPQSIDLDATTHPEN